MYRLLKLVVKISVTKSMHTSFFPAHKDKFESPCKLEKVVLEFVLQDDYSTLVPLVEIPLEFDIGRILQYFENIKILSVEFKDSILPSPPVSYSSVVNKANLKHLVYVQLGQVLNLN